MPAGAPAARRSIYVRPRGCLSVKGVDIPTDCRHREGRGGRPVYRVVHPAAGLLHTELTPFILAEQFAFWDQPRHICWQHHVSGRAAGGACRPGRVRGATVWSAGSPVARAREHPQPAAASWREGLPPRAPARVRCRAEIRGTARAGWRARVSPARAPRTCTRIPCQSTFRCTGSWAPWPLLLRDGRAAGVQARASCVRARPPVSPVPSLGTLLHIPTQFPPGFGRALPGVPAASASPSAQKSTSASTPAHRPAAHTPPRCGACWPSLSRARRCGGKTPAISAVTAPETSTSRFGTVSRDV